MELVDRMFCLSELNGGVVPVKAAALRVTHEVLTEAARTNAHETRELTLITRNMHYK